MCCGGSTYGRLSEVVTARTREMVTLVAVPIVLRRECSRSLPRQPRRAASMVAMSIFAIGIIASKARFASAPPAASASVSARGVICQDRPQRSLHHPHWLSLPPLPTIAFQ